MSKPTGPANPPEPAERLALLADAYLHGELSPEGVAELESLLRADPANVARFIAYTEQAGMMREVFTNVTDQLVAVEDQETGDFLSILSELDAPEGEASAPIDFTAESAQRELEAKQRTRRERIAKRQQAEGGSAEHRPLVLPKPLVWLGLAAALGLAAWVVVGLSTKPASTNQQTTQRPDTPASPGGDPVEPAARVASLGGSVDAVWADGYAWQPGTALHADQRLELVSGFAEVTTAGGTTLTIEGPCELTLSAADTFAVAHGRLMVETRDAAGPVTVRTPSGAVVHERAAFGLDIAANDDTRVVVFGGRVDLFGTDARGGLVGSDPFEVSAGRVAFAARGDLSSPMVTRAEPADRAAFAPSLAQAAAPSFRYRRAVLSSGPVAYWTFDEDVDEGVPNLADPGTHDLRAHGRPVQEADGVSGGAARLDNLLPPYSYFETANAAELLGGYDEFTVELWFKAERRVRGTLLDLYPAAFSETARHALVIELQDDVQPHAALPSPGWVPYSVRGLHRDPPAYDNSGLNLYTASAYRTQHWHHVVLVKRGTSLLLYLDGEVRSQVRDTGQLTEDCRLILGAAANIHFPGDTETRPYSGLIDEVAVYPIALQDQAIAEHYRLRDTNN